MKTRKRERRLLFRWIMTITVSTVALWTVAGGHANAGTVQLLHSHTDPQPVSDDYGGEIVTEYAAYEGSLFFYSGNRLLRIDSVGDMPVEVPVPGVASAWPPDPPRFTVFDGALYFHASRELPGYPSRVLFRLDGRFAAPAPVDIQSTIASAYPESLEISLQGVPVSSQPLVQHNGKLYVFVYKDNPLGPMCDNRPHILSLFRIDNAQTRPVEMKFNAAGSNCSFDVDHFITTPRGLAFQLRNGVARSSYLTWSVYLLSGPMAVGGKAELSKPGVQDELIDNVRVFSSERPAQLAVFDGAMYFASDQVAGGQRANNPGIGPYLYPGPINELFVPFETELSRKTLGGPHEFFDLHATTTIGQGWGSYGSSNPNRFTIAHNALYFQASPDNDRTELWRVGLGKGALPEIIELNANASSNAAPIGAFQSRLWLVANTGSGLDIHYMDDDGISAIPLHVSEAVASTAHGFTEFAGGVLFTAKDVEGFWGTYLVKLRVDAGKKAQSELSVSMATNQHRYPRSPGLRISVGGRVNSRCVVQNRSFDGLHRTRIAITSVCLGERANGVVPRRKVCVKPGTLVTGRRFGCRLSHRVGVGPMRHTCVLTTTTAEGEKIRRIVSNYITGMPSK